MVPDSQMLSPLCQPAGTEWDTCERAAAGIKGGRQPGSHAGAATYWESGNLSESGPPLWAEKADIKGSTAQGKAREKEGMGQRGGRISLPRALPGMLSSTGHVAGANGVGLSCKTRTGFRRLSIHESG